MLRKSISNYFLQFWGWGASYLYKIPRSEKQFFDISFCLLFTFLTHISQGIIAFYFFLSQLYFPWSLNLKLFVSLF